MKRPQNFNELLNIAKERPDVHGALAQVGISLKRVGASKDGVRWQTETKGGTAGDFSAIAFIEKPGGKWIFFDNKGRFGKTAVDPISFLREGFGISFDDAVYMLSGGAPSAPIAKPQKLDTLKREITPQEKPTYTPPTPAPDKLRNVKAYLIQTRKLPKELVLPLIDSGRIYSTYYENPETHKQTLVCAFKITDEDGNDVGCDSCAPQPEFKFKHLFTGSNADYAWCFPYEVEEITSQTPIFFCESPIDAMSLCAFTGTPGVYVSMAGLKDSTFNSMTEKLGGTPYICVDNDEAGDKFAARHSDVPRMVAPIGKDWNDTLKHYVENNLIYAYSVPDAVVATDVPLQNNVGGGHVVHLESEDVDPKKENGALDKGASDAPPLELQINDWLEGGGKKYGSYNGQYFDLGITPQIFIKHGAVQKRMVMLDDCIVKITGGKHDVSLTEISKLVFEISNPVLLFKGSQENSFICLTELETKQGHDIIVAIHKDKYINRLRVNKVASMYSKTNDFGNNRIINYINNQINSGNLLDANKEKAPTWFTSKGLQLPELVQTIIGTSNIIPENSEKVNTFSKNHKI